MFGRDLRPAAINAKRNEPDRGEDRPRSIEIADQIGGDERRIRRETVKRRRRRWCVIGVLALSLLGADGWADTPPPATDPLAAELAAAFRIDVSIPATHWFTTDGSALDNGNRQ